MGLINLLIQSPGTFFLIALPLLYSVILHEIAHGWVALKMGDRTAKRAGRLTLNPLKHLDPVGTLMLFIFGFGWARPVPVDFSNLHDRRRGLILVSSAGVAVNLFLAFAALFLLQALSLDPRGATALTLYYMAQINIILAAFNLIPIPPLDGSKILMGFLPARVQSFLSRLEPYGLLIIIALLYLHVLDPIIHVFRALIVSFIKLFLFTGP